MLVSIFVYSIFLRCNCFNANDGNNISHTNYMMTMNERYRSTECWMTTMFKYKVIPKINTKRLYEKVYANNQYY